MTKDLRFCWIVPKNNLISLNFIANKTTLSISLPNAIKTASILVSKIFFLGR